MTLHSAFRIGCREELFRSNAREPEHLSSQVDGLRWMRIVKSKARSNV